MKKTFSILLCAAIALSGCQPGMTQISQTELTGNIKQKGKAAGLTGLTGLNDASRIIKSGPSYFWYSTGGGIRMRWTSSPQSGVWHIGPDVFAVRPAFWTTYSPINIAWAPDVIYHVLSGEYRMYYCVSSLGSTKSAIGLATNTTLDPADPAYLWVDKGIVISSEVGDPYNAIDPCPIRTHDNEWFLCFGSHVGGIKLIRLGPDGKRHPTLTNMWNLARKEPTAKNPIEAGAIYPGTKNGVNGYWLFVNWGSGLGQKENATYEVRVGWSADIRGPYLDKSGADMYHGGGTVFMPNQQTFVWDNSIRIGRGHIGIIKGEKLDGSYPDWVTYSYWLKDPPGGGDGKRFGLQRLITDADGWPDDGILFQN